MCEIASNLTKVCSPSSSSRELYTRYYLELGLIHHFHHDDRLAAVSVSLPFVRGTIEAKQAILFMFLSRTTLPRRRRVPASSGTSRESWESEQSIRKKKQPSWL